MTQRERQILQLIEQDPMISQQEIADKLGITRSSVAVHISNLMQKGTIAGRGYVLRSNSYVAVVGGISLDAMKMEVDKAFKRRVAREKKKQEKIDLDPMRALQPKERSIRYDNMRSALAEEGVIAQILREPALLDVCGGLTQGHFSVSLLGRVYAQFQKRHSTGMEVSLGVLEDMAPEEMSHLAGISQKQTGPVNETAFRDCIKIILGESQSRRVSTDDDLLAFRNKLKESKGTKQ